MRGRSTWGLLLLVSACHAQLGDGVDSGADGRPTDASDAMTGDAPLGPWGAAAKIGPASSTTLQEDDCTMSSNQLELYFAVVNATSLTKDLYVATRTSTSQPFGDATPLPFNVAGIQDETPRLSGDDLTLYFGSARAGGAGAGDIWYVRRNSLTDPWGAPTNLAEVNSIATDKWFMPCGTGGRYMLVSNRGGLTTTDLFEGRIGGGPPTQVADLSSPTLSETGTFLTQDCLTIFFARGGGLMTSTRASVSSAWQPPTSVTDFAGTGGNQQDPWMSGDQRTFIFASDIAGTNDVYMSTR